MLGPVHTAIGQWYHIGLATPQSPVQSQLAARPATSNQLSDMCSAFNCRGSWAAERKSTYYVHMLSNLCRTLTVVCPMLMRGMLLTQSWCALDAAIRITVSMQSPTVVWQMNVRATAAEYKSYVSNAMVCRRGTETWFAAHGRGCTLTLGACGREWLLCCNDALGLRLGDTR